MRCPLSVLVLLAAGVLTPAASALAAPAHGPAGPKLGSFGLRLVDVPVSEAADPRAMEYIIDHVPPGMVLRRRVQVENKSSTVGHVTLYPDAATIRHGSFVGDGGQTRSELTTWIRISRQALTLAPQAKRMVTVTIRVPRNAAPGERYGVLWSQESARIRGVRRLSVTEVNRVGIRIYLLVGPGGAPPTNFVINRITGKRQKGDPVIVAQVSNTGGRAIDLSGKLSLSDGPGGVTAGPFPIKYGSTLAPGQTGQIRTVLAKRLPDGPWRVMIDLESDLTERKAYATIDFAGHIKAANSAALRRYTALGAILIIVLGLAVLVRQRLTRRNRKWETAVGDRPPN